jgi:hypothetical protein
VHHKYQREKLYDYKVGKIQKSNATKIDALDDQGAYAIKKNLKRWL